ncbi:MAG TPA: gamma-glutamyltransferase [Thermohalobaculum sp.]|nr:gamma-glutamyltransferase [Thermohalobaculum sp.]
MTKGLITAPQPEAVEAGADVLRDGGNAVDAAVACALVQTAVDPIMCGVAGFGSMHVYMPGQGGLEGAHRFIDFHGRAPAAARPDMWQDIILGEADDGFGFILEGSVNEIGYQSITTPMTLRALDTALARFGTRSLADLIQPAIAYCEDGFQVRPHINAFWNEVPAAGRVAHREFLTRNPGARQIYTKPDGSIYRLGEVLRNPDMGRTYRRIAEHGVDDFYTGAIAAEIAADMAKNGGLIAAGDLAAVAPTEADPLWGTYRGHRVATNNPPGGGIMILEMLNILENFDLAAMGHNSPEYIATVSEAMKIATVDKDTKVGDPRFVDVPVAELTSKDYAAVMADRIRRGEKAHVTRLNVGNDESKETTHICVVDGAGNCVSLTHSIGMPAGVVTPGLGFMYNGCMGVFDPRPGRAGSLAPGKSRFTAMCPTILFDGDNPWLVIGAPGGTYITMGVLQGILNAVDFGMTAQEAVSAPRFCTTSDTIDITNRILRRTEAALKAMGYPVRRSALGFHFAGVHAARRTAAGWDGGADPGRDGMALSV